MKKILLFITFTLLFTIFSCTPDEIETQPKKKIEKKDGFAGGETPEGPGDGDTKNPPPKA